MDRPSVWKRVERQSRTACATDGTGSPRKPGGVGGGHPRPDHHGINLSERVNSPWEGMNFHPGSSPAVHSSPSIRVAQWRPDRRPFVQKGSIDCYPSWFCCISFRRLCFHKSDGSQSGGRVSICGRRQQERPRLTNARDWGKLQVAHAPDGIASLGTRAAGSSVARSVQLGQLIVGMVGAGGSE